jgi:hypothetical protein
MIAASHLFDQSTLTRMRDHDPVVQRYRTFLPSSTGVSCPNVIQPRLAGSPSPS